MTWAAAQLRAVEAQATAIAEEAGALISEGYRQPTEVRKKGVVDLVTDFDLRAEKHVVERLRAAYPEHVIVAEEGAAERNAEGPCWYVDPIDGTTSFAHGHPFFCVSIALYDGSEGLVGAVHAPALGVTWSAARGRGARRNRHPCHVSQVRSLHEALVATGFPYDRHASHENNLREFGTFMRRAQGIRRCGSAALDLCLVADGTYDGYWEQKLSPWDMAAGAFIVHEAGGRLSRYDGGPADPLSGKLVASNGLLHDKMLAVLQEARQGEPLLP